MTRTTSAVDVSASKNRWHRLPVPAAILLALGVLSHAQTGPARQPPSAPATTSLVQNPANPVHPAGLYGLHPDGHGSLASQSERYSYMGTHAGPYVGHVIELSEEGSGKAEGPERAAYGLGITVQKKNWVTSRTPGEINGLSIFGRQGVGDFGGILTNIGVLNGFGVAQESYTFAADPKGAPTAAVNTQLGVVNTRDNYQYGLVVQAVQGKLSGVIRVAAERAASWYWAFENVVDGQQTAAIRSADGAFIGGPLLPRKDRAASIGTSALRYRQSFANPVGTVRIVRDEQGVALTSDDDLIVVRRTLPKQTSLRLPSTPFPGERLIIKDGRGDANKYPILISGGIIQNSRSYRLDTSYGVATLIFDGAQWVII